MKRHVPSIIYGICLILKCYSIINFSELKNSILPEFRQLYVNKWFVGEVAFEVMSLLVLWYLWRDDGYSKKQRILLILGCVFLNLLIYLL